MAEIQYILFGIILIWGFAICVGSIAEASRLDKEKTHFLNKERAEENEKTEFLP